MRSPGAVPLKYPLPLKFHKGKVQLQASLSLPHERRGASKAEKVAGAVFLEIANEMPRSQGKKMAWDQALTFKLGIPDLSKIGLALSTGRSLVDRNALVHAVGERVATLSLAASTDPRFPGSYKWSLGVTPSKGASTEWRNIFLAAEDMYLVRVVFDAAMPLLLGWSSVNSLSRYLDEAQEANRREFAAVPRPAQSAPPPPRNGIRPSREWPF